MFDDKQEESSKIKVGELEFSEEELTEVVGAGQRLRELEEKQGQPIDDVLKSWGRRGETIGEQKKQLEELQKKVEELSKTPETVEEEATAEQIIAEAKKYGLMTKEDVRKEYEQLRAGEKILAKTSKVIRMAEKEGKPSTTLEDLLTFMNDPNNPKDPQIAYEVMFRDDLKKWEREQIETLKNKGMETETTSSVSKDPEPTRISTKEGLQNALSEHFANFGK